MSLTEQQNTIIDASLEQFHSAMIQAGESAWKQIEPIILAMPTLPQLDKTFNLLYPTPESGEGISEINSIVYNEYLNSNYENGLDSMRFALVELAELTKEYYASIDVHLQSSEKGYDYNNMVKGLITTIGQTDFETYFGASTFDTQVMQFVSDHLRQHIANNDSMQVTMTSMAKIVEERFYSFSITASLTLMAQYIRRLNEIYATYGDEELRWVEYQGADDGLTRDFCKARIDGAEYYHIEEVKLFPQMYAPWDGMIPKTDRGSIFVNLGGYNCRHSLVYVSVSMVGDSDKQRASNILGMNF